MGKLRDYFEKVFVINLHYKPERREKLSENLRKTGLAEPDDIEWVRAISGDWCCPPHYYKAGNGAWGCLQSHTRVVQDAIMGELGNYLVLEDDAVFHENAADHLDRLMKEVPEDWDQLYLGGQHLRDPDPVVGSPFVFKGNNINRTHAFALRKSAFVYFLQHISHAPDYIAQPEFHIDHQLGVAHERGAWKIYAPTWWLAGQEEGSSNISGRSNPQTWWNYYRYSLGLPFVWVDPDWNPETHGEWGGLLHFGNNLKEKSFEDIGLDRCVGNPHELYRWLEMIAREAMDVWKLPALQHGEISAKEVEKLWPAGVKPSEEQTLRELRKYPGNGLFPHPLNADVGCFGEILPKTSAA